MTRTLFVIAFLLLLALVGSFVGGLAGGAPALLMLSLLCAGPVFFLIAGAALGRASTEFTIARKEARRPTAFSGVPVNNRARKEPVG